MGLPVATLKKGEGRMLKAGGLWIFDNEIAAVTEDAVNGELIAVQDFDGYPMGTGFCHQSFNRFLIISLDVLICRYSPLLRAFPALFISEEPHKSFYYPSCFHSQK